MRWISYITIVILCTSCSSLKPVINNRRNVDTTDRVQEPVFLDNITISPLYPNDDVNTKPKEKKTSNKKAINTNNNINNEADVNFRKQASINNNNSNTDITNANTSINNTVSNNATTKPKPKNKKNTIETMNALAFKYAIILNVTVEELNKKNKLLAFIDEWYGIPYRFGGCTKKGIDCSSFTGNLLSTVFGIEVPRMAKDQYDACQRISKLNLEEGDLVFFHTTRKGISHVGVYLANNKFIHASLNNGVTISDLSEGYYARKLVAAGRPKQSSISFSDN